MQVNSENKLIFLVIFFLSSLVSSANSLSANLLQEADSLFAIGHYNQAKVNYEAYFDSTRSYEPNLLTKLAYISEQNGDVLPTLYYLSCLAKEHPSSALYVKMETLADKVGVKGYEFNDFSYFILFYKKFEILLYGFALVPFLYVCFEVVRKYKRQESIKRKHKVIILLGLFSVLIVFNLNKLYKEGVITASPTFLREHPSSAAAVVTTANVGNKVVILRTTDMWKMIVWDRKMLYLRGVDVVEI